jgi:hypothetical protein
LLRRDPISQIRMTLLILAVTLHSLISNTGAFGLTCQPIQKSRDRLQHRQSTSRKLPVALFAEAGDNKGITEDKVDDAVDDQLEGVVMKALGAASSSASGPDQQDIDMPISEENTVSSQVFMITREMKRTMVEELGYKRKEVDSIRLELVANVIENRIQCPSDGMPVDWIDRDRESVNKSVQENSNMMERLENESKYPLKFPLLATSLVLFGKGFSDALITLIKVNIDFPGASLTAQFQGIPVLAIDGVCVIVGMGLGLWTWKTMK